MSLNNQQSREYLTSKLDEIIARLGLNQSDGLIYSWEQLDGLTNRHVIRQAFEIAGAYAVFGFNNSVTEDQRKFTPILYLCTAKDDIDARQIHRLVWSQGVVPLLLIGTPSSLQVRRSLAPPPDQPSNVPWDKIADSQLPVELTSLTAVSLCSSIVWRDFSVDRSSRVDRALLESITSLSHILQDEQPELDRSAIHAVIGRFLYLYVLLDRGIINSKWIGALKFKNGQSKCSTIANNLSSSQDTGNYDVWPANEVWALFDAIDEVMNGTIFPVVATERAKLTEQSLHLVHRVIRHGDRVSPGGRQLSFVDVTFSTLRTETISAIYELFLSIESTNTQSDDGAFYTPPFLVDYVLDETDRIKPFTKSSRVLDPAAGSGTFLVGAYRRILERTFSSGHWTAKHFRLSRKLLEENIYGIERNPQAANVCRFSLYLTLLDYFSGANISKLIKMSQGLRVFPTLTNNIYSRDVFTVEPKTYKSLGRFTHVVGNPPWGSFGDSASRTNKKHPQERQQKIDDAMAAAVAYSKTLDRKTFPVSNKRLSELFIWKIKQDLLAEGGALGILLSTRSFVSRSALAFPNAMASQFALKGITNLSHFRNRLFVEARSPTIAIFARNEASHPMDEVWVYSPLLSSQPIGERGHLWSIIASTTDIEIHRLRDLTRTREAWFNHLILRPLDRRYAHHLKIWTDRTSKSLGDFLKSTDMRISRGGSPSQTGLPNELLLKADYRSHLGSGGFEFGSYPHNELEPDNIKPPFQNLFGGNVLLIPRSMNDVHFIQHPIGFSSTFNSIHFMRRPVSNDEKTLLKAMAKYLTSDVANYFYAIVGKSWILDHARLEKHDLEAVPFPIDGIEDNAIPKIISGSNEEITNLIAERMGFDRWFTSTVGEYTKFRSGYEDAQLPPNSLRSPDQDGVRAYTAMLKNQLLQTFGSKADAKVDLQQGDNGDYFKQLLIKIGQHNHDVKQKSPQVVTQPQRLESFNPYAIINYDPYTNIIVIVKPWTHAAWTMEQAFADARGISVAILQSRVS